MTETYEAKVHFKITVEDAAGLTPDEIRKEIRETLENSLKLPGYMVPFGMDFEMYVPVAVTAK